MGLRCAGGNPQAAGCTLLPWHLWRVRRGATAPAWQAQAHTYHDALRHAVCQDVVGLEALDEQLVHHQLLTEDSRTPAEGPRILLPHATVHHPAAKERLEQVRGTISSTEQHRIL